MLWNGLLSHGSTKTLLMQRFSSYNWYPAWVKDQSDSIFVYSLFPLLYPPRFFLCCWKLFAMMQITAVEWMLLLEGARPNLRRRTTRGRESDHRSKQVACNPDPTNLDERVRVRLRWCLPT